MYYDENYCDRCKKVTGHYNGKCGQCKAKEEAERARVWEAQDIETKLTNLRQRIEGLERGPAIYG